MTTYVLGAGVSLHAGYPLSIELGDAVRAWLQDQNHPVLVDCRVDTENLHHLYGGLGNFEDVLTDLKQPGPGSPAETLDDIARSRLFNQFLTSIREFFAHLAAGKANLYRRLARERVRAGDTIVTFNYDVEVERELKNAKLWGAADGYGFPVEVPRVEVPPSPTTILKLHGSANWLGLLFAQGLGLGPRPVIFGTRDFCYLGYPEVVSIDQQFGGVPAMVLPMRNKQFYMASSLGREWEDFWDAVWAQAAVALASAEKVALIGYSMPLADDRARALLLKSIQREACITVSCRGRSLALAEELRSNGINNVRVPGDGSFEGFIESTDTSAAI